MATLTFENSSEKTPEKTTENTPMVLFEGDVVHLNIKGTDYFAEILSINEDGSLDVSCIKPTEKQGGRIWEFVAPAPLHLPNGTTWIVGV